MTLLKKTKQTLIITSILGISAIASISNTALAATPQDCAGGYVLAVHGANTTLQNSINTCVVKSASHGASPSCVQKAVALHKASLAKAHDAFEVCMSTAVTPH